MKAGELRHKVTVKKPLSTVDTAAVDTAGQPVNSWVKVADVWAAVEPLSGRELMVAQQKQPDVTHRVRMRHRSDVTPKMLVDHNGRELHVESILNIEERDREIHLMCRERI